jgi:hypothetical protein
MAEERKVERIIIIPEAKKSPSSCMNKYKDPDGTFKGGKGEAFNSCVKAFTECRPDVRDPEGMCAAIGRKAGKIK